MKTTRRTALGARLAEIGDSNRTSRKRHERHHGFDANDVAEGARDEYGDR